MANGRKFRTLNLMHGYSREALAIEVDTSFPANAQQSPISAPQFDLSGGYSYVRANSNQGFNPRGANASFIHDFADHYSAVGEFGAYRFSSLPAGLSGKMYTYLAGPRIAWRTTSRLTPYSQILLGAGRLNASAGGVGAGENAFAMSLGGGIEVQLNSRCAIRAIQADYLLTQFARVTGASATQNNLRLSTRIVLHFGHR